MGAWTTPKDNQRKRSSINLGKYVNYFVTFFESWSPRDQSEYIKELRSINIQNLSFRRPDLAIIETSFTKKPSSEEISIQFWIVTNFSILNFIQLCKIPNIDSY